MRVRGVERNYGTADGAAVWGGMMSRKEENGEWRAGGGRASPERKAITHRVGIDCESTSSTRWYDSVPVADWQHHAPALYSSNS